MTHSTDRESLDTDCRHIDAPKLEVQNKRNEIFCKLNGNGRLECNSVTYLVIKIFITIFENAFSCDK